MESVSFTKFSIQSFHSQTGRLNVYDFEKLFDFPVKRMFTIQSPKGAVRGKHAHYKATQALIVLSGSVRLSLFDGKTEQIVSISDEESGLIIPPRVWIEIEFVSTATVIVFSDREYEEVDYIRDRRQLQPGG